MIKLSVVIINFNTCNLVKKCLESVMVSCKNLIAKKEMEIIVIDNSSKDESCKLISKNFPDITLVKNKTNEGFGKANNQGIKISHGEYILLLNSDTEVKDDGIGKLLDFINKNKTIHFAGGKLLNPDLSPQASCGPFYSLWNIFLMLFLKGDKLGITRYSPSIIKKVDWVSGACLLGKKEDFEKAGLFDENIFMYMDEIDFLYRARKLGMKIFFYPDAKFIHLGSGSSQTKTTPVLNIYKGLIYFYEKYKNHYKVLLLRFMLKLKALLSLFIGSLTGNNYLIKTYGEAIKLA